MLLKNDLPLFLRKS